MPLPKLAIKTYTTTLPFSKKEVEFRQYSVKEERALLMANESDNQDQQFIAMMNLLRSCVLTPDFDPLKLAQMDLEWLFIRLRVESVGEVSKIYRECESCKKEIETEINLNNIKISEDPNFQLKHVLDKERNIGIQFKIPDVSIVSKIKNKSDSELFFSIIENSIDLIWHGDNVYKFGIDFDQKEATEFINNLTQSQFEEVTTKTFQLAPKLYMDITSTCKYCKTNNEIHLEGMFNFFA